MRCSRQIAVRDTGGQGCMAFPGGKRDYHGVFPDVPIANVMVLWDEAEKFKF